MTSRERVERVEIVLPVPSPTARPFVQPRRRQPNQFEQDRTKSNRSTHNDGRTYQPELTKIDHPQPPIPRETLKILPYGPQKKFLAKQPNAEDLFSRRTQPANRWSGAYSEKPTSNEERPR